MVGQTKGSRPLIPQAVIGYNPQPAEVICQPHILPRQNQSYQLPSLPNGFFSESFPNKNSVFIPFFSHHSNMPNTA
jgi:hypothetical protein